MSDAVRDSAAFDGGRRLVASRAGALPYWPLLATAGDVRLALNNQMLSPVRWVAVIERFASLGVGEIFEAGEDGTLTRMLRDFRRKDIEGRTAREVLA